MTMTDIRIGGRKSPLAVAQSEIVKAQIEVKHENLLCLILAVSTFGDEHWDQALYTFGGKSLWTKELEVLLLQDVGEFKQIDLIVHSLKDMPTNLPEEFELGCIVEREDPRDALLMAPDTPYKDIKDLPAGSVVGTSSIRRSAQLLQHYPHLKFESVRGSIHTRINKLDTTGKYSCIILAAAGLHRMGLKHRITRYLGEEDMYYSVGQGALGIEIRKNDERIKNILRKIEHKPSTYTTLAERSLMRYLEGGCSVPLGVISHYDEESGLLCLKGNITSPDGKECIYGEYSSIVKSKADCEQIGITLGDILIEKGAKTILDQIDYVRINQRPEYKTEN